MIIGSSRNSNNSKLFVKSNVSVCVDPVEEPSCKMATYMESSDVNEMAGKLLGLAADFQIRHSGLLQLSSLIVACRHRMASLRASLFFLLHASCLLSLILLFSIFLFLPIIFTHGQILMTSMLHLPVLFFGTLFTPFHPKNTVIRIAMKNTNMIAKQENVKIVTTFFIQFLPTAVYITALYFLLLVRNANMMCSFADVVCNFNTEARSFNSTMDYLTLSTDSVRHIIGFQFTTCLCVLSSAFLYSLSSIWTDVPFLSPIWLISVFFCIFTQVAYSYLSGVNLHEVVQLLPIMTLVVWIMVILLVNELFKIRRIRQFAREQRRTKFDFDTKLGMNSPY
ncbi:unnamed protein product [Caenorhabditis auriculariae]|uniref:Uncharacterized protein n=1 Tax=Caenorhabditis auriculariae TaxID=2777116 RepID=A0A8S1H1C9_9PELO|nr:unnamed protein product [Caenorhabditis auriculariae]